LNTLNVPGVEPALNKLLILFNKSNAVWIVVDFSFWGKRDYKERDKFNQLWTAILSSNVISFEYLNSHVSFSSEKVCVMCVDQIVYN